MLAALKIVKAQGIPGGCTVRTCSSSYIMSRKHSFVILIVTLLSIHVFARGMLGVRVPKVIAFDLDGTVWNPEMYELWGGGSPFTFAKNGKDLVDRAGVTVRLIGITDQLLETLRTDPVYADTKVAWVSCTDEPNWAAECLQKFKTSGDIPIGSVAHSSQIFKADKQVHFKNLQSQFPDIDYADMLFFDNERRNCVTVSKLGVKCIHCKDGMTREAWEQGLSMFT